MAGPATTQALRSAIQHHQAGRLPQAATLYRSVLARDPACVDALHYLGLIEFQFARYPEAAELLRRAAARAPRDPAVHGNLGAVYSALHRFDESVVSLRHALALRPQDPVALSNLGKSLTALGQLPEALSALQQAAALRPSDANTHNNLGNFFKVRRQFDEAAASFRQAITLQPDFVEALNNMGTVLVLQGRNDEALPCLERACTLRPDDADIRNNLGSLLALRGQLADGMASFRRALELQPGRADIHSNLILLLQYHAGDNEAVLATERQQWQRQHARPLAAQIPPHGNERSPDRRLRLGYVSADFRDHVVGYNLLPLFAQHRHDQFQIFCYAQVPQPDSLTEKFRALADHWRDIAPLNDAQLAEQVRQDGIDVLVDLALHSAKNRLLAFARKPAPVQVSFAGYPAGTGLETIDCHLTDPYLEPALPDEPSRPDAPFRLPHTFWCYVPQTVDQPVNPLPALTNGFVTFGCLNNFCKVTDATLRHWTQVLLAVPQSRLLLLIPEGRPRQQILEAMTRATIAPERITFVDRQPREKYLALYHRIDLGLDTFPYNGHTTSLDSYWMGVPVVTLVGPTGVSRAGWSQLSNLGLTELAAHHETDFVRIVATLAQDTSRLSALRAGLRERMQRSPLMDAPRFCQGIESAYRTLWQRWCIQPTGR